MGTSYRLDTTLTLNGEKRAMIEDFRSDIDQTGSGDCEDMSYFIYACSRHFEKKLKI